MVICDEVHHASSYTYQTVLREFNAKYIYGQTATIERSDKLEKIIELIIGPVLYEQEIINEDKFKKILIPRFTRFTSNFVNNVPAMINELIVDSDRNSMIVDDIRQEYIDNKHILVLTDRLSHIQKLHTQITSFCKDYLILHGQLSEKERTENFAKLKSYGNNPFIILATGKFIGEGFDDERLDTLFITSPFKWIGTLSQYVGRLHREVNKIKELKVYDYVDIRNYTFRRMYNVRQSGYNALGYVASSVKSNHNTVFIYNTKNYENLLKQDLLNAKICIHLFINEYSKQKISELIKYIKTDVSILLNSKYESFAISITKLTDSEIPNLIVIDKRIV
jgi:superfamily II DNA or RNA helicase